MLAIKFVALMDAASSLSGGGIWMTASDVCETFEWQSFDKASANVDVLCIAHRCSDEPTACSHGVFVLDGDDESADVRAVRMFLHKPSVERLRADGLNRRGEALIDSNIWFSGTVVRLMAELYARCAPLRCELDAYGDFLRPLATECALDYIERVDNVVESSARLVPMRRAVFNVLRVDNRLRLAAMPLARSRFVHFGTAQEYVRHYGDAGAYRCPLSRCPVDQQPPYCALASMIDDTATIGRHSVVEYSRVGANCRVGRRCLIVDCELDDGETVEDDTLLWTVHVRDDDETSSARQRVRINLAGDRPLRDWWTHGGVGALLERIDHKGRRHARAERVLALCVERMARDVLDVGTLDLVERWRRLPVSSDDALLAAAVDAVHRRADVSANAMAATSLDTCAAELSSTTSSAADFRARARRRLFDVCSSWLAPLLDVAKSPPPRDGEARVALAARLNLAGGWTDTPPIAFERRSVVLNVAVLLDGELPIRATATLRRRPVGQGVVRLVSADQQCSVELPLVTARVADLWSGAEHRSTPLALHRACLYVALFGGTEVAADRPLLAGNASLSLELRTDVAAIPQGTGLGTSSILMLACIRALVQCWRANEASSSDGGGGASSDAIAELQCNAVLCVESMLGNGYGGGWQDQWGGALAGIKLIEAMPHSSSAMPLSYRIESISLPRAQLDLLNERMILIYTGAQRRASNVLDVVVSKWCVRSPALVRAIDAIARSADTSRALYARFASLSAADIDQAEALLADMGAELNRARALSCQLDSAFLTSAIDAVFARIEHHVHGATLIGAGGGGFIVALVKRNQRSALQSIVDETDSLSIQSCRIEQ
jgi:galactokinase/mevalonate kinase-like predicted kinase